MKKRTINFIIGLLGIVLMMLWEWGDCGKVVGALYGGLAGYAFARLMIPFIFD